MEGQGIEKKFTLGNLNFDCWVIEIGYKFWFKGHDIAVFLDYKDPDQAVRCNVPAEAQKKWEESESREISGVRVPSSSEPNMVLISERGVYRLVSKSTKPEAIDFEKWVFDELLPNLRETRAYKMTAFNHKEVDSLVKIHATPLKFCGEQVQIKEEKPAVKEELDIKLQEKFSELSIKAAVMTVSDETKHVFQLYRHLKEPNKYVFIRTQKKYLKKATEAINPQEYKMLLEQKNLPSAMNILNRLKEKLKETKILYEASWNRLTVDVDVLKMVDEVLKEPLK